jgi:hypothetical protein
MTLKKSNPAAANCRARETFSCLAALNNPEITSPERKIQYRRAAWIARRYAVPMAMAQTIAGLFFGEAANV